ncbi:MAG TPA: hypothetical protein VKE69_09360, partial [Planctomycetota bacterium]|nr:hypothetical protein [Planctomycetota bacterium]
MTLSPRLGLRGKFVLFISALVLAHAGAVTFTSMQVQERQIRQRLDESARATTSLLAETCSNALALLDVRQLGLLLSYVRDQKDVLYAYAFDPEGRILADGTTANPLRDVVLRDPVSAAAIAATEPLQQVRDQVLDVCHPVVLGTRKTGGVRIGFSLAAATED